ncbi:hypothetical protein [Nocardioides sp. WS12]|uniref:hypothetical protein n=1 Tax=Nocardioides sp. WS12 TaxID=2486272 RepID=UPI0015FE10CC|nr:hypothetical protein [Nocardioides sp. WS12]
MSDNYGDIVSEGKSLKERFIELEIEYQAMQAYNYGNYDEYKWTDEEKLQQLSSYTNEYRDEIASWFADLDEMFADLADLPDPASLISAAEGLEPALVQLAGPIGQVDLGNGVQYPPQPNFSRLPSMENYLVDWNGVAADNFKSNYLPKFAAVAHHEFHAVASLKSALLAAAEMWKQARLDVSNIIDECNSALDDYDGGKDSADAVMALGIIGAIVAVAAVPFTGGSSAVLYWTLAGSALTVTGAVVGNPPEPKKELDIKGDSPAEICQSLREGISDMKIQWIEDEAFIRDQLYRLSDTISGYSSPSGSDGEPRPRYPYYGGYTSDHTYSEDTVHGFVLPRPSLADLGPGNVRGGFGQPEV